MSIEPASRKRPPYYWHCLGVTPEYTMFQRGHLCALSSVAFLDDGHQPPHWEWVLSFSNMGRTRLTNEEIKRCLTAFDALEFEEDNHSPGVARKFWLALDPQYRKPCPCKDETVITEGDYKYSAKNEAIL